jgi:hypothetical protein
VRQIRGWENGDHYPRDWRTAYATAFGLDEGELFSSPSYASREDDVLRREFLGASLATGLALTSAPSDETGRVGKETVERLRQRASRLRRLDDFLGGADTYRVYAAELAFTSKLVSEASYTELTDRALMALGRMFHQVQVP